MLRVAEYAELYTALLDRGLRLVNDPVAYRVCHHLPDSYPFITGVTPRTVWLPIEHGSSPEQIGGALQSLNARSAIVKDYVKSQKHYWAEACFIPDTADREHAHDVIRRFLDLQGDSLAGGLVFREYVPLKPIGHHTQSGMPVALEYRTFVVDGRPTAPAPYWDGVEYPGTTPDLAALASVLQAVPSRFFSADFAYTEDGHWLVVELGDGQVAGLPASSSPADLFAAVRVLDQP